MSPGTDELRAAEAVPHGNTTVLGVQDGPHALAESAAASAASAEHLFRLLIEGVKDYSIFMLDGQGRVITWNPGAERIEGYRRDEILGQHLSRFYPTEDLGKADRALRSAETEGRFEEEGWRARKD